MQEPRVSIVCKSYRSTLQQEWAYMMRGVASGRWVFQPRMLAILGYTSIMASKMIHHHHFYHAMYRVRLLTFEEIVDMPNNNAHQVCRRAISQQNRKGKEHPWQIRCREREQTKEAHSHVLVPSAPYIHHHKRQWRAKKMNVYERCHQLLQYPIPFHPIQISPSVTLAAFFDRENTTRLRDTCTYNHDKSSQQQHVHKVGCPTPERSFF